MPPASEGSFTRASQPIQLWKESFCSNYPQKVNNDVADDPGTDPLFKEPLVDQHIERKTRVCTITWNVENFAFQDLEMYLKQKKDQQAAEQRAMQKIAALWPNIQQNKRFEFFAQQTMIRAESGSRLHLNGYPLRISFFKINEAAVAHLGINSLYQSPIATNRHWRQ